MHTKVRKQRVFAKTKWRLPKLEYLAIYKESNQNSSFNTSVQNVLNLIKEMYWPFGTTVQLIRIWADNYVWILVLTNYKTRIHYNWHIHLWLFMFYLHRTLPDSARKIYTGPSWMPGHLLMRHNLKHNVAPLNCGLVDIRTDFWYISNSIVRAWDQIRSNETRAYFRSAQHNLLM